MLCRWAGSVFGVRRAAEAAPAAEFTSGEEAEMGLELEAAAVAPPPPLAPAAVEVEGKYEELLLVDEV